MVEANREVRELLDKYQSLLAEREELASLLRRAMLRKGPGEEGDTFDMEVRQALAKASPQSKEK